MAHDVGTVSVKVLPDLSEFLPAIREEIRQIVREEITAVLATVADRGGYKS